MLILWKSHAGYAYSGKTAAQAYKWIEPETIEKVFILGPSHRFYVDGAALSVCDQYETPLGNLELDKKGFYKSLCVKMTLL